MPSDSSGRAHPEEQSAILPNISRGNTSSIRIRRSRRPIYTPDSVRSFVPFAINLTGMLYVLVNHPRDTVRIVPLIATADIFLGDIYTIRLYKAVIR